MTQIEFIEKIKEIFKQEEKYGVEIKIEQLIDKDHLDCLWYGGQVGSIKYKGYTIVIGAYGDIRINGKIDGAEVDFKDTNNTGRAYEDIAVGCGIDDDKIRNIAKVFSECDEPNYLIFKNNNWFEVDLISPDGEWIDLWGADNVLDNNILDCFSDVSEYFEYVDWAIKDEKDNKECLIDILLDNGYYLIAQQCLDPYFPKIILLGIVDKNRVWHQDLASVGISYRLDNLGEISCDEEKFEVDVFGDKNSKDCTKEFKIELIKEKLNFMNKENLKLKASEEATIDIPLCNGYHLVAVQNTDPSFSKEIFIGIKDKDGVWHQDLAVVRNSYVINDSDIKYKDGEFDVLVYSDKDNEDFTHDFTIGLYKEEKE